MSNIGFTGGILLMLVAWAGAADETTSYKVTTQRANDRVDVKADKDRVVFSVASPQGISHAVIERAEDKWPATVVLQLHLKGLESLRVVSGETIVEASVSSQDGHSRIWLDGQEDAPLSKEHPHWMAIRVLGADGKPSKVFPLHEGYMEVPISKALLEQNPKSITIHWIDFYRN